MGTTINRAIPYVEPADLVNGFPTVDKAAADRLDALLFDTGWVDVTVNAGFAPISTAERPRVRRIGSVVYSKGGWTSTGIAASVTVTVGSVPAGFRPLQNHMGRAGTASGVAAATISFSINGDVGLRTNANVSSYYQTGNMSWLID